MLMDFNSVQCHRLLYIAHSPWTELWIMDWLSEQLRIYVTTYPIMILRHTHFLSSISNRDPHFLPNGCRDE